VPHPPGQKVAVERPRVRTRAGQKVELDSYARLQHDEFTITRAIALRQVDGANPHAVTGSLAQQETPRHQGSTRR